MRHGKFIFYQENQRTFPGQSVFELNLEEREVYRCARIKVSQGPEAGTFMGQGANAWHLSSAYCMPGDVQSSLNKLFHSVEKTEAQRI